MSETSATSEQTRVSVSVEDHVAEVRLSRPDKHNALDAAMFLGIVDAIEQIAAAPGVRAVVLHGEGPSFCSGLDVASFMGGPLSTADLLARDGDRAANLAQRVAYDWTQLPMPVIAAVHGCCFGGGLQIALGADVRIAAHDASLSVMEIRWGLVPDMAITQTLPRLVRMDVAKELVLSGRRVDGEEAARLGLVTRLADDPLAVARELAHEIAGRSPDAVRAGKRMLRDAWLADAREALLLESELQTALIGTPNQLAAVTAGLTKQPAEFTDLA
jgi:enoyl-CoA hydratase/carnithine racemase